MGADVAAVAEALEELRRTARSKQNLPLPDDSAEAASPTNGDINGETSGNASEDGIIYAALDVSSEPPTSRHPPAAKTNNRPRSIVYSEVQPPSQAGTVATPPPDTAADSQQSEGDGDEGDVLYQNVSKRGSRQAASSDCFDSWTAVRKAQPKTVEDWLAVIRLPQYYGSPLRKPRAVPKHLLTV